MFATFFAAIVLSLGSFASWGGLLQSRSTIEGRVIGVQNRPVDNIRVFLLNDSYQHVTMIYSEASGRFRFQGIAPGTYYIQVEPAGTDYERQTQRLEVNPFKGRSANNQGSGGETFFVDVVLKPMRVISADGALANGAAPGVTFYQDVPPAAKTAFQNGVNSLKAGSFDTAVTSLKSAIETFPTYYDALELLGTEYVKRKDYNSALPLLNRAVVVNNNGYGLYPLGVALLELRQREAGIDALRRAVKAYPNSINASMRLGMELAKDERMRDEAIKSLMNVTRLAEKRIPEAYLMLASLYSKSEKHGEAATALKGYLQTVPQDKATEREKLKNLIKQLEEKAKNKPAK